VITAENWVVSIHYLVENLQKVLVQLTDSQTGKIIPFPCKTNISLVKPYDPHWTLTYTIFWLSHISEIILTVRFYAVGDKS
jgi:hypothetical protein